MRKVTAFICLIFIFKCTSVNAQYNSYESGYDSNIFGEHEQEIDPPPTVASSIRDFIRGVQPKRQETWGKFEKLPKDQVKNYYMNSEEYRMKNELRKPMESRRPFDDAIDEMKSSLKTQKKKTEESTIDNSETSFMGR